MSDSKTEQKTCAACARENEIESAISWCANCGEALCSACDRSHRRNKVSGNHKLIVIGSDKDDLLFKRTDVICSDHPEEVMKCFCYDHYIVCCTTCAMSKHIDCDKVGSVEDAADAMRHSEEALKYAEEMERYKRCMQLLLRNRNKNVQIFNAEIQKTKNDIKTLFKRLSDNLEKTKTGFLSKVTYIESEIRSEIQKETCDIESQITSVERSIDLFLSNKRGAPPAQYIQTMEKLYEYKITAQHYVTDGSRKLRDIRVEYKPDKNLLDIERCLKKCYPHVRVDRSENAEIKQSEDADTDMFSIQPILSSEVDVKFSVTGIALLKNGNVLLSNTAKSSLELRDNRCLNVLSSLPLGGIPYGIKMISYTEGGVAVKEKGIVLFLIQDRQIKKKEVKQTEVNLDFVYNEYKYYSKFKTQSTFLWGIGAFSNERKDIYDNDLGYIALKDDAHVYYTVINGIKLYCTKLSVYEHTLERHSSCIYSYKQLQDTRGVTIDHAGYIYVCGYKSRNVHQLSHDEKQERIIFDNLSANPICTSFSSLGNKAVIGCDGKVLLYDLK